MRSFILCIYNKLGFVCWVMNTSQFCYCKPTQTDPCSQSTVPKAIAGRAALVVGGAGGSLWGGPLSRQSPRWPPSSTSPGPLIPLAREAIWQASLPRYHWPTVPICPIISWGQRNLSPGWVLRVSVAHTQHWGATRQRGSTHIFQYHAPWFPKDRSAEWTGCPSVLLCWRSGPLGRLPVCQNRFVTRLAQKIPRSDMLSRSIHEKQRFPIQCGKDGPRGLFPQPAHTAESVHQTRSCVDHTEQKD